MAEITQKQMFDEILRLGGIANRHRALSEELRDLRDYLRDAADQANARADERASQYGRGLSHGTGIGFEVAADWLEGLVKYED
jgi:hypothetical protein